MALAIYFYVINELIIMDENKQYTLYNKMIDFKSYIRNYVVINIPNIHKDIRIHLMDECYKILDNLFHASYNKGNIRMKYLIEMKCNLSMIDVLITDINNLKCVKDSYVKSMIGKITDIKTIIYGWILNEENKKK